MSRKIRLTGVKISRLQDGRFKAEAMAHVDQKRRMVAVIADSGSAAAEGLLPEAEKLFKSFE